MDWCCLTSLCCFFWALFPFDTVFFRFFVIVILQSSPVRFTLESLCTTRMEQLPQDLLEIIFQLLSPKDFYSLLISVFLNAKITSSVTAFLKKQKDNTEFNSVFRTWKLSMSNSPQIILDRICNVIWKSPYHSRFYIEDPENTAIVIRASFPCYGRYIYFKYCNLEAETFLFIGQRTAGKPLT